MKRLLHRLMLMAMMALPPAVQAQCFINELPFFNDFENETAASYAHVFPACWTRINDATGTNYYPYVAFNDFSIIHGNRSLYWRIDSYSAYAENMYAVLPPADGFVYNNLRNLTLSFYARTMDTAPPWPVFIVGVMHDSDDTASFTAVDTIELTPSVALYAVSFAGYSDTGKYIAIRCPRTTVTRHASLDDIYLNLTSHWCNPVANLCATATSSTVTLSWSPCGNSSFTVALGGVTVSGVTDTFYTFMGLSDSTTYSYAVAAECPSSTSIYLWGSIQTECHTLTYDDLPYREDFESYGYGSNAAISPCWHKGMSAQTFRGYPGPLQCYIGDDTVGLGFSATTDYSSWAALPRLDDSVDVADLEVEFVVKRTYQPTNLTQLVVGVATDFFTDSTNNLQYAGFVAVDTLDFSDEPIYSIHPTTVRFESYTGSGKYVLFLAPELPDSIPEYVYNGFYIDDVKLKVANPCPTPQNVRVTRVTFDSVFVAWDSIAGVDTFQVYLSPSASHLSPSNNAAIGGLNPDTDYELRVVALCSNSNVSDTSYPVSFHTLCAPITTLPFTEDFEGLPAYSYPQVHTNILPHCWMYWNVGTEASYRGFPVVYADAAGGHSGSNALRFNIGDTSDQIAILPLTSANWPLNTLQVSFWLKPADVSNFELTVGIMSDPTDTGSFIPVRTIHATTSNYHGWQHYAVGFANYSGPHGHVAFKAPWSTPRGNRFYIDDVTLQEMTTICPTVEAIHAETTASAALLTWDYNIEFGTPIGFSVSYRHADDTVAIDTFTYEPMLLLTGLGVDSLYHVTVTADCGNCRGMPVTDTFRTQALPCIDWDTTDIAGDTLTLGNPGTGTNSMFPVGATARFTYVQHLFTASEIPVSGPTTLKGIGFDYAYTQPAYHANNCNIYLSHTTRTDMSDGFVGDQQQLVYTGSLGIDSEGWNYVLFNQGLFEYDGVSNLCVTIVKNSDVITNSNFTFRHETTPETQMTRWGYRLAPNGAINVSPVGTNMRSNTRLITSGDVYCGRWATCLPPVVHIDTTDAGDYRISWIPGYNEASWDVDYRIADSAEWTNVASDTTATSCIIPVADLMADTRYEFRVTANCSDTNLYDSVFVVTPCDYIDIPFSHDFEGLPAGNNSTPADIHCWHHLNDGGYGYNGMPYICGVGHSGNRSLIWGFSNAGNYGTYQAIVLPPVDGDINSLYLSFWAKCNQYCQAPAFFVGVMIDPEDINTFHTVDTVYVDSTLTDWDLYEASLANYSGIGQYIAIRFDRPAPGNWGAFMDDIRVSTEPICRRVRDVKVRNVTPDSATVSWTTGDARAGEWELTVGNSTYYSADTVFTVHNLTSNTPYTVTVRAICGEDDTSVACSASFRTPCYLLDSLPYINDFENDPFYSSEVGVGVTRPNAVPVCWLRLPSTQYSPYVGSGNTLIHGNNSLCWEIDYVNGPESEYAVLPPVDMSVYDISDLSLSFYAKTSTNEAPYPMFVVGVMENSTDTASFVAVDTIVPDNNITLYTVSFADYMGTGNYITIRCPRTSRDRSVMLDDIYLTDQMCYPPFNLHSSVTDTTVTVLWTPGAGSSFSVILGADTVRGVTDTFYTFQGLTDGSGYHYAVAAECSGSNSIFLTGSTLTECHPLTLDDLPYREDFEAYETGFNPISPCWHKGTINLPNNRFPNPSNCLIDNDSVGLYFSASSTYSSWATLPRLDDSVDIAGLEVTFLVKRPITGTGLSQLVVGVVSGVYTDSSCIQHFTGFVPVDTVDFSNEPINSIHSASVQFENYTGNGRYIIFYAPPVPDSLPAYTGNGLNIDNVELKIANPCHMPQNVRVTRVTHDSVYVAWDTVDGSSSFLVLIGLPGEDIGTFTPYYAYGNSTGIGNIAPDTEYELMVVANCSGFESDPSFHIFFHTLCAPIVTLPFVEDFESVTGYSYPSSNVNNLPSCWLYLNIGSSSAYWGFPLIHANASYAHGGTNAMRFGTPDRYGSYLEQIAIMPLTDATLLPVQDLQVSFWARSYDPTINHDYIIVGVITDPADNGSFVPVDTVSTLQPSVPSSSVYTHHTVSFARYTGTQGHVAFKTTSSNRPYIDDIILEERPCSSVDDLHVSYTTTDSIVIAWSDTVGDGGAWYVEYDTAAFTPGSGAIVPTIVTDTFYIMTGLDSGITYHIYIYPACLDSVAFHYLAATTLVASPAPMPYSCGFDDDGSNGWTFINGTQDNRWMVGNGAGNPGGSLYITDDGISNHYNGGASIVFATRTFRLDTAGEYVYSFDWRCNGESTRDFLRVALVPDGTVLSPGDYSGFDNISDVPAGGIPLDGATCLNGQSEWQNRTGTFTINEPGNYMWVFMWRNDGSTYNQTPAAVDNVTITLNTCPRPYNISGTFSANNLNIAWTPGGDETMWEVTLLDGANTTLNSQISTHNTLYFTGLPLRLLYTVHIRSICGPGDTSMTATASFVTPRYRGTASANNPDFGQVSGSGMYYYGDNVTLTATPYSGYGFIEWNDSIIDNPRYLTVTCDTTLTAIFAQNEGIDAVATTGCTIYPNPAKDAITVTIIGISGKVCITVLDFTGREVMSYDIVCAADCEKSIDIKGLSSGAYILRVTSESNAPMARKLIVE